MKKLLLTLLITILTISSTFAYNPTPKDKQLVSKISKVISELPETKRENLANKVNVLIGKLDPNSRSYYILKKIQEEIEVQTVLEVFTVSEPDTYKVKTVVDGDTVYIIKDGKAKRLRMIGIDAPESTALRFGHTEPLGKEATNKLKSLIGDNEISLEYDETQGRTDKHGRDLVYIFVGDRNINQEMILSGYAKEYTYDKPYKYQKQFKQVQEKSKENKLGIWGLKKEVQEEVQNNLSETNYTGRVKGNISTKTGEKIYHIPGCPSYKRTRISTSKGERYFNSEEEARKAGWRKAKNCN